MVALIALAAAQCLQAQDTVTQEDWSTIDRSKTHLIAEKPVVAEREELDSFYREMIRLKWRLADPVDIFLLRPKGVEKPPVVLFLYSFPQGIGRFREDSFCRSVIAHGYAVVGFESALTGERYRLRPMREWFVSELPEALACTTHDVQYILDYLETRSDLDTRRIGMFGQGSGATIALLAAAADSRIKAVDAVNPWCDFPQWITHTSHVTEDERPQLMKEEFLKRLEPLDPVRWIGRLSGRKVRLQIIGGQDKVPQSCLEKLAQSAPPNCEVLRYPDPRAHQREDGHSPHHAWMAKHLKE